MTKYERRYYPFDEKHGVEQVDIDGKIIHVAHVNTGLNRGFTALVELPDSDESEGESDE